MRKALDEAGYDDIPGNGLYVIGGLALGAEDVPLGQLIKELRISKQAAGHWSIRWLRAAIWNARSTRTTAAN